jgi:hypothetical protein
VGSGKGSRNREVPIRAELAHLLHACVTGRVMGAAGPLFRARDAGAAARRRRDLRSCDDCRARAKSLEAARRETPGAHTNLGQPAVGVLMRDRRTVLAPAGDGAASHSRSACKARRSAASWSNRAMVFSSTSVKGRPERQVW